MHIQQNFVTGGRIGGKSANDNAKRNDYRYSRQSSLVQPDWIKNTQFFPKMLHSDVFLVYNLFLFEQTL